MNNVIKTIVSKYGEGIFLESSRLHSIAADLLQNKHPEILRCIGLARFYKIPDEFYLLKSSDDHQRKTRMNILLHQLLEHQNEKTSYQIINMFAESLGFNLLDQPKPSANNDPTVSSNSSSTGKTNPVNANITPNKTSVQSAPTNSVVVTVTPKVGSIMKFGGYDWRVLEVKSGKALLLSDKIIENRAYHNTLTAITWSECDLRKYLKGEFFNSFSQADRNRILETTLKNKDNQWYGTNGGNATTDKVFLLSLEELVQYFGDSGKLKNRPKDVWWFSDQYSQSRIAYTKGGTASWWWLRSPGDNALSAAGVRSAGDVDVGGGRVSNNNGGVRPALWLNL